MSQKAPPPFRGDPLQMLGAGVVMLIVGLATLYKGAVLPEHHGWIIAAIASTGIAWVWARPLRRPTRSTWLALLLVGLVASLPLVPLPPALVGAVAPSRATLVAQVAPESHGDEAAFRSALAAHDLEAAVGSADASWSVDHTLAVEPEATVWRPLSLDPDDHRDELLRWGAALTLFLIVVGVGRGDKSMLVLSVGLAALGTVEAIIGLANLSGNDASLGLFAKKHYLGSATGTLVNRNHFAALLAVCIGATWGLASGLFPLRPDVVRRHARHKIRSSQPPGVLESAGDKLPRLMMLAFVAATMSLAVVLSQSRAGLVCLALAGVTVALVCWWRRGEEHHLYLAVGLPTIGGALAVGALGPRGALGRFGRLLQGDDSVTGRLETWRASLAGIAELPFAGAGLGSFDPVHVRFVQGPYTFRFAHAHNDYLQLLFEGGALLTGGVAVLAVLWARRIWSGLDAAEHRWRTDLGLGLMVGTVAMLLHAMVDFNFQIPGNGYLFAVCLGAVTAAFAKRPSRVQVWGSPQRVALTAALVILAVGGWHMATRGALEAEARAELARMEKRRATSDDEARMRRIQARVGDQSELGARLGLLLADLDVRRALKEGTVLSVDAAVGTLSSVLHTGRTLTSESPFVIEGHLMTARAAATLALVLRRWPGAAARARITAEDLEFETEQAVARADILQGTNPWVQLETAAALLTIARGAPHADSARHRAAMRLAEAVRLDPWRASAAFSMADRLTAAQLEGMVTSDHRVLTEAGRAWKRRGAEERAVAAWEAAYRLDDTYPPALFQLGASAVERGDDAGRERYLRAFLAHTDGNASLEGWAYLWLGQATTAEKRFERAVRHASNNAWIQYGYAQALRSNGRRPEARKAFETVLTLDPGHAGARAALSVLNGTSFHDRSL